MRIAFDCTTAAFPQKTGTGVYVEELVRNYESLFAQDQVIHTYRLKRRIQGRDFLLPARMPQTKIQTLLDPVTAWRGRNYDIFHGLNSRLPYLWDCLKVATIHDLFSIYGQFATESFRKAQEKNLLAMISKADHFISVSHYTKSVMVEKLGIAPEKISVVHNGVRAVYLENKDPLLSQSRVAEWYGLREPYFLYVGALEARKNIISIIEAYNRFFTALNRDNPPKLVLAGHGSFGYEEIKNKIKTSPARGHIVELGFVENSHLDHLYRASLGLIYLSLEEGFGIPVLEAMACGVPVLSSNTTSLPEAGYGCSWMVAPQDTQGASDIMMRFFKKDDEVMDQIARGKDAAKYRSWGQVARETRAVYEMLLRAKSI